MMIRTALLSLILALLCPGAATSSIYAIDLSNISTREQMESWDSDWIDEQSDQSAGGGYELQVDPGGIIGVWTGSGNPSSSPDRFYDYSSYKEFTGITAGEEIDVWMRFLWKSGHGVWVQVASLNGISTTPSSPRQHYECALQNGVRIYKAWWEGGAFAASSVSSASYTASDSTEYWLRMNVTRVGNSAGGDPTILCELYASDQTTLLQGTTLEDDGDLPGLSPAGKAVLLATNKMGMGGFTPANGVVDIREWYVESLPEPSLELSMYAALCAIALLRQAGSRDRRMVTTVLGI